MTSGNREAGAGQGRAQHGSAERDAPLRRGWRKRSRDPPVAARSPPWKDRTVGSIASDQGKQEASGALSAT